MDSDNIAEEITDFKVPRREFMHVFGAIGVGTTMVDICATGDSKTSDVVEDTPAFKCVSNIALDLNTPSGITVSPDNRTFVAGEDAIIELDGQGRAISRFAINGRPESLLFDADAGFLLGFRDHVAVLDVKCSSQGVWSGFDERTYLTAMTADEDNVYVADAGNRVVLRFDKSGTLLNRIGELDEQRGIPGLVIPAPYFDVALDPMGTLWVVNLGRHGLENYRPDGSLIKSWYKRGSDLSGFCGCCNPIHIAFRSDHSLVTVEKGLNRIKVLAPDFTVQALVAGPRSAAGLNVDLTCSETPPVKGLAIDAADRILVLNTKESVLRVFEECKPEHQSA